MVRIAVLASALLMALAGCSVSHRRPVTTEKPATPSAAGVSAGPTTAGGRILAGRGFQTLVAAAEVHFLAELRGQLAVDSGGCLVLRQAEVGPLVVVWPPGVTLLTGDREGVRVPGVGAITVGDHFSGVGGYADLQSTEDSPSDLYPTVPSECTAVSAYAVFGSISNVGTAREILDSSR